MTSKIYTAREREQNEQKQSRALTKHAPPAGKLLTVEKARQFLAQSKSVDEVKDVADKAKAVEAYLRVTKASTESINDAVEIQLRAEYRLGQLTKELPKAKGTRTVGGDAKSAKKSGGTVSRPPDQPPTLAEQGIDKRDAAKWRQLAELPEKEFDQVVEAAKEDGKKISAGAVRDVVKKRKQAAKRAEKESAAKAAPARAVVVHQDALALLGSLEDQSVDLLCTDPPYSTDVADVSTFAEWLAVALRKLKPTGRGYVCIGAYPRELLVYLALLEREGWIDRSQVLVWTYRNTIGPCPTHDYKLNWQAILYVRGVDAPPLKGEKLVERFTVQDINAPDGRLGDRYHAWQKPDALAERFVLQASHPGELVVDPFACTGTFLVAAALHGRKAIGCDINIGNLEIAVQRGCLLRSQSEAA